MSLIHEIAGYAAVRELTPGRAYEVHAPGGRRLVLKRLDDDCLVNGQLHPSVRDRLGRVRELAHAGIANLYGVEREAGDTWLVWEYVEGVPWSELDLPPESAERRFLLLARELVLTVQMLHARGIIHGDIHPANIFQRKEKVTLTHISPYLWADPHDDADAVIDVLIELLPDDCAQSAAIARMLDEAQAEHDSLDTLLGRLTALIDQRESSGPESSKGHENRQRVMTVMGAVLVSALTAALGWIVWQYIAAQSARPMAPPEAPPSMMHTNS